jgi:hypothetical protein
VAAGRVPELKCPELVPDANVGHHGAHAHSYSQPRTDERERVGKAALKKNHSLSLIVSVFSSPLFLSLTGKTCRDDNGACSIEPPVE